MAFQSKALVVKELSVILQHSSQRGVSREVMSKNKRDGLERMLSSMNALIKSQSSNN